jgi:hypothetical protein
MTSVNQGELHADKENQAGRYLRVSGAVLRLSGGWLRSGHKFWAQVSILSIKPALAGGERKAHRCAHRRLPPARR